MQRVELLDTLPGAPGDGEPWTAMSVVDGPLSRFPVVAGRLPAGSDEAAVSEDTARRRGLQPGATLTLTGADGRQHRVAPAERQTGRALGDPTADVVGLG